jgi:ribonuclease HI
LPRQALEEARECHAHLRQDSERVVNNLNAWAEEQKDANEKLGEKIREQTKNVIVTNAEKE